MSESTLVMIFLALSGGLQDIYSFICRGGVFANAQTGNIVLICLGLLNHSIDDVLVCIIPILFFVAGVMVADVIKEILSKKIKFLKWEQSVLLVEIFLLFISSLFSTSHNFIANAIISFSCAMQVQTFRKADGKPYASTMCVGNLRSFGDNFGAFLRTGDKTKLHKALYYILIISCFAAGCILGAVIAPILNLSTIYLSCILLLIAFSFIFIKTEEEAPATETEVSMQADIVLEAIDTTLSESGVNATPAEVLAEASNIIEAAAEAEAMAEELAKEKEEAKLAGAICD